MTDAASEDISSLLAVARGHLQKGEFSHATQTYLHILKINPSFADAWIELSIVARRQNDISASIENLKRAYDCNPDNPDRYTISAMLANSEVTIGALPEAEEYYRRAIDEAPAGVDLETIYFRLACTLEKQKKFAEARDTLAVAIRGEAKQPATYGHYGALLEQFGHLPEAMLMYKVALKIDPSYAVVRNALNSLTNVQGYTREAREANKRAWETDLSNITALWAYYLNLPMVYDSVEQIEQERQLWRKHVAILTEKEPLNTPKEKRDALAALSAYCNFLLPYQGGNRIEDMTAFGQLVQRIMTACYPQWLKRPLPRTIPVGGKIRVAFISGHLRFHSVMKSHQQWIVGLDRNRFEVYCFQLGYDQDHVTEYIKGHVDHFFEYEENFDAYVEAILRCQVDVIIFLDVGMQSIAQLLAALRLAPVQCMTWGHPITTGLNTIDYFLSSELMEPNDGASHYVEALVKLPNLSSCYAYPDVSQAKVPTNFLTLKDTNTVFLNAQSIFKQHPQYDDLYPRIALQAPASEFHFIARHASQPLIMRLKRCFESFGLAMENYCVFHAGVPTPEFFGLVSKADIVLDSPEWSGFNTSMESLALDVPVVTLPGDTMRARHTYAILKMMDIPELIAQDKESYVKIAVRLATDATFRQSIVKKIKANKHRVYNDATPIHALEAFLVKITTH